MRTHCRGGHDDIMIPALTVTSSTNEVLIKRDNNLLNRLIVGNDDTQYFGKTDARQRLLK